MSISTRGSALRLFILWNGSVELTKDDGLVLYDWRPISLLGAWIFVSPGRTLGRYSRFGGPMEDPENYCQSLSGVFLGGLHGGTTKGLRRLRGNRADATRTPSKVQSMLSLDVEHFTQERPQPYGYCKSCEPCRLLVNTDFHVPWQKVFGMILEVRRPNAPVLMLGTYS